MDNRDIFTSIRKKIFKSIHDKGDVKFNDIKNSTGVRSNDLSYHLNILVESELLKKDESGENTFYALSEKGKMIYPYLPIITEEQKPIFVVCCAALISEDEIYLQRKPREPEKGSLIFFGGKVLSGHIIEDAVKDYVGKQAGCGIKDLKLRCINEFMRRNDNKVFHNIVYFYTAKPVGMMKSELIRKKLSMLDENELFWDNKIFIREMLHNEEPKIIRTII